MVITYFDHPIETIQYKEFSIDYVNWGKGVRLLEVNKKPHHFMPNWEFNFFMTILLTLKSQGKI